MGIPKFFRYFSERYPLTSQLIQENKIPEFDNLYLDFNGIIHNCSHPNDDDAHFRLAEEQIFTSIFAYVDHLFGKVKPKKLFFMAIDGVAPRAKMNQQRSRRFRTAKEAKELREKAESKGEKLPEEKAFDSNCITPGTLFMAKLSEQLRYFINKKISEDANWREVQVILSGHEVPGEGEHKIMEYIRLSKAQPDYNPNVRHCLYGLDADLIMLGLLSHDPHFCLLREEVKFGPARKKSNGSLETQNFFLLHLSLLREYLDLEFTQMAPFIDFQYNVERVIDDFVLIAMFVGNDFLPHLPDLHINDNALEKLFDIYKRIIPKAGGYLNESGMINMRRLQMMLDELASTERGVFEKETSDISWFKGKQKKHVEAAERAQKHGQRVLTKAQATLFEQIRAFLMEQRTQPTADTQFSMLNTFSAGDKRFLNDLAAELNLNLTWDEYDDQDRSIAVIRIPKEDSVDSSEEQERTGEGEWEDVNDEEGFSAVNRVLTKYAKAKILDDEEEDFDTRHEKKIQEKMDEWKRAYYREKLEIDYDDPKQMHDLVYRYVEGLQWVCYYYYSGVASWSWFYNYHYAPRMSDLRGIAEMEFDFDLGTPFRPFGQLMGVMPEASKELLPEAYRDLMYDPNSPIIDFYPQTFEQDMNGKKQEWEAVVKIPFIDQDRLLKAMASREHRLTDEERRRNSYGTSTKFSYDPDNETVYPTSLPGFFPNIVHCRCKMEVYDLPTLNGLHLVPGLCDGVLLGVDALAGFPSLHTLKHTGHLGFHHVNVFQGESRNQSMVIKIENSYEGKKTEDIARKLVGKRVFIQWPFLQEGMVVAVSDEWFKFEKESFKGSTRVISNPNPNPDGWKRKADKIEHIYSKRFAVLLEGVEVLLHVRPLKGLKRLDTGALVKEYEDMSKEVDQAVQLGVLDVVSEDQRYLEKGAPPLHEEFPQGSKVIFLGEHAYGVAAQVRETTDKALSVVLAFFPNETAENEQFTQLVTARAGAFYHEAYQVSRMLSIGGLALAKITSSLMVTTSDGQKTNIGLNLKFEAKGMKVLGYSRKGRTWEFSDKAVELIREYKTNFPELFRRLDQRKDDVSRASDFFPDTDADAKVKAIRVWLTSKGVRDLEAVSLYSDQLDKETVGNIEQLANEFNANKSASSIRKAVVKGIPRQAVLKPSHAVYRLQDQDFILGDRVTMVQDSGGVPLCAKGVVVGINSNTIDVLWDVPFMSGTTLSNRCSQYRGSTVAFNTCLNLTNKQFVMSTSENAPVNKPVSNGQPQRPNAGPYLAGRSANGHAPRGGSANGHPPRGGFRPANGVAIMSNPQRPQPPPPTLNGSYGNAVTGNNAPQSPVAIDPATTHVNNLRDTLVTGAPRGRGRGRAFPPAQQAFGHANTPAPRGFFPRGRGGSAPNFVQPPVVAVPGMPVQNERGGRGGRGVRGRGPSRGAFMPRGRGAASHVAAGQA